MPVVAATLFSWIRKSRLSFAGPDERAADAEDCRIYRLKSWPDLPTASRTAEVLRLLSVMSQRPVNRRWIISHTRLKAGHVDSLLQRLVSRGAVEVIEVSGFSPTRSEA
jgi:hypothetical protein